MISVEHVIEVALLVLAAYLAGCLLGYGAHAAVRAFAARPRFESRLVVQAASAAVSELPPVQAATTRRSAARRLAGAVEREDTAPVPAPSMPPAQRPADLPAPRGGTPNDLKQIKGIGVKTESALNDLGIYHLDQIAKWTEANIDWLEGRIAVKGRIKREQWVEQAILLMTATTSA